MTGIYVWAAIVFLGSVAVISWPLWRRQGGITGASDEGLKLLRDRLLAQLAAVEQEQADGAMDATMAAAEVSRIELELSRVLQQLDQVDGAAEVADTGKSRMLIIPAVLILAAGAGLYLGVFQQPISQDDIRNHAQQQQNPHQDGAGMSTQVAEMVGRLAEKMKTDPDNVDGWKRLVRSYQVLGQMDKARDAMAQVYRLLPDDVSALAEYASLSYAAEPGNTGGKTAELYDRLLKLRPTEPSALWFKGIAHFQKSEYGKAIEYWNKTMDNLPMDNPARQEVQRGIDEAKRRMSQ
ncbi:MAG: hypothetical protein OEZ10_02705 [Gammaproteobacteria bacterium]|nr:hypothetical protein [Gammaproteobacteria bacterium]